MALPAKHIITTTTMTTKQLAKFKNTNSYRAQLAKAYPFGLDDTNDDQWAIITLLGTDVDNVRAEWEAQRELLGYNSLVVASAIGNANDTVAEGRFEENSYEYFRCAILSLNP